MAWTRYQILHVRRTGSSEVELECLRKIIEIRSFTDLRPAKPIAQTEFVPAGRKSKYRFEIHLFRNVRNEVS